MERRNYGLSWTLWGAGFIVLGFVLFAVGGDAGSALARILWIGGGLGMAFGLFDVARSFDRSD